MQHWKDQAKKNGLTIVKEGSCQLCGAKLLYGIEECINVAANVGNKLDHAQAVKHMTLFLTVDAHALQHSEIHGRWNNHFHLTRLHLILYEHIQWTYTFSTLLSSVLDEYKISHLDETILTPIDRGEITVADIDDTDDTNAYIKEVYDWARDVYRSYSHGHDVVINISDIFKTHLA
jgi:hypothetical protein